ncbi:Aldo/keto reductase [Cristinia sonorae]|uniref:Aldo/keto reductase n=1 Tax=Cristinia sonorae TaxID=1940300 RepID=A0A8K0XV93_9AGAR|nr:Aldo/keto reductase [Cristinia sonorae]
MALPSFPLNNGESIPAIGAGCWISTPGGVDDAREMVENALKIGYRHIDTAFAYQNEESVGQAIRNSGIPRDQIYLVTKLYDIHHGSVQEGLEISLKQLGVDYVDLYLMHWPQARDPNTGKVLQPNEHPNFVETWKAMEQLLDTGKVKSIGVSNFSRKNLEVLLPQAKVIPAVNQIELHPLLPQLDLLEFCREQKIVVTAYSPLGQGHPDLITHAVLKDIALRLGGVTTAQVIMGWFVKKGIVAIPKSSNPARLRENITYADISADDEAQVDAIHRVPGMHRTLLMKYHEPGGKLFGWTYEQLGWPAFKEDGVVP